MGEFFATEELDSNVVYVPRNQHRSVSSDRRGLPYLYEVLVPRPGTRQMEPIIVSVNGRKAKSELRMHPGEQFVFVIEGGMNYVVGNREFTLGLEDCLYFDARVPHGPKPKKTQKARYLVIFTTEKAPGQRKAPAARKT